MDTVLIALSAMLKLSMVQYTLVALAVFALVGFVMYLMRG